MPKPKNKIENIPRPQNSFRVPFSASYSMHTTRRRPQSAVRLEAVPQTERDGRPSLVACVFIKTHINTTDLPRDGDGNMEEVCSPLKYNII